MVHANPIVYQKILDILDAQKTISHHMQCITLLLHISYACNAGSTYGQCSNSQFQRNMDASPGGNKTSNQSTKDSPRASQVEKEKIEYCEPHVYITPAIFSDGTRAPKYVESR